jgi:hypothetical protein
MNDSRFILVLAPDIETESESWDYPPFNDWPLVDIMEKAKEIVQESYRGKSPQEIDLYYQPYPYYFSGKDSSDLTYEAVDGLMKKTYTVLLDGSVLYLVSPETSKRNLDVIRLMDSGKKDETKKKQTCCIIQNGYTEQACKDVPIYPVSIHSDDSLVACIQHELNDIVVQFLQNLYK